MSAIMQIEAAGVYRARFVLSTFSGDPTTDVTSSCIREKRSMLCDGCGLEREESPLPINLHIDLGKPLLVLTYWCRQLSGWSGCLILHKLISNGPHATHKGNSAID